MIECFMERNRLIFSTRIRGQMSDKIAPINVFGSDTEEDSAAKSYVNKGGRAAESGEDVIKNSKSTYDKKFKQLFTTKKFLTPILKNIVPEYKEYSLEQIETFITPRGDVTINPAVYSSEDSGKGDEMTAYYDVFVDCALPDQEQVCVDIFFDLEMQRKSKPGYSIPKRGIYYCCRLISRQLSGLDKEEAYDQLKPVYSVWILINDIPQELRNSIYSVDLSGSFHNKDFDGSARAAKLGREVDLIHLRLIYLSEDFNIQKEQSNLIKYLQSVFANKVGEASCNPYHEYSRPIEGEVNAMMSMADALEAKGIEIGERRGEQRGIVKVLLQFGKTDAEIIQYLTTELDNPLAEDEAEEVLESCRRRNR